MVIQFSFARFFAFLRAENLEMQYFSKWNVPLEMRRKAMVVIIRN